MYNIKIILVLVLLGLSTAVTQADYSTPLDVAGTEHHDDFKFVYKRVFTSETRKIGDGGWEIKDFLNEATRRKAKRLIELPRFKSFHGCKETSDVFFPRVGFFDNNEDVVRIAFECEGGTGRAYDLILHPDLVNNAYKYWVSVQVFPIVENDLWD